MTTGSVLIFAAAFAAAFGLLVWWLSRRRGSPENGLTVFLGIAGVYVGFWGVMKSEHWLYVPCVALILASYAIDFAARRRHRTTGPADSSSHHE
jgi:drug/metabolite transporter (DMT)-like permease